VVRVVRRLGSDEPAADECPSVESPLEVIREEDVTPIVRRRTGGDTGDCQNSGGQGRGAEELLNYGFRRSFCCMNAASGLVGALLNSGRSSGGQMPTQRFNLCVPERLLRIDRCRTPRRHVAGQQRHSAEKHEHSGKCRRIPRGNLEQHTR
jgi:hypothetical protein